MTPTSAVESSISVIAFISKHLPVVTVAIHTPAQRHSIIQSTYDVSDKGGVQSFALEDCMNLGVSVVTVEVVTKNVTTLEDHGSLVSCVDRTDCMRMCVWSSLSPIPLVASFT